MIKIVYIGEDDYMARLKHGDVFCEWTVSDNGNWYIIRNKNGEEISLSKNEVALF